MLIRRSKHIVGKVLLCDWLKEFSHKIHGPKPKESLRKPYLRFDMKKAVIQLLPNLYRFNGKVIVIDSPDHEERPAVRSAIEKLSENPLVGFDSESKPIGLFNNDYTNGLENEKYTLSIFQVAIEDLAVIWRIKNNNNLLNLSNTIFPPMLKNILSNPNVLKVGCGITHDLTSLFHEHAINVRNVIDVQQCSISIGAHKHFGLVSMAAELFHQRISKSQRKSNWDKYPMTFAQIQYAATDAWATFMIFKEVERIAQLMSITLPTSIASSSKLVMENAAAADAKTMRRISSAIDKITQEYISIQPPKGGKQNQSTEPLGSEHGINCQASSHTDGLYKASDSFSRVYAASQLPLYVL